jgi:DNA-directed RNA polymerase subunit E'/Rpb7
MLTILSQVIQKIGLCISLYDVLWTSEGLIGHGTGLVNVNGKFLLTRTYWQPILTNL